MSKLSKRDALAALATDAKELVEVRERMKALRTLEEAALAAIKRELEALGKEVVEVEGYVVVKEPGVSMSIDKAALVAKVGAKVVEQCQKQTEFVRIKVRRTA